MYDRVGKRLPRSRLDELEQVIATCDFGSNTAFSLDLDLWRSTTETVQLPWSAGSLSESIIHEPRERSMYFAAFWLEAEVNNGGFGQFFLNKGPAATLLAKEFLEHSGPGPVDHLLKQAIARLPPTWTTSSDRDGAEFVNDYRALDDAFYDLPSTPFVEARLRFAHANRHAFFAKS